MPRAVRVEGGKPFEIAFEDGGGEGGGVGFLPQGQVVVDAEEEEEERGGAVPFGFWGVVALVVASVSREEIHFDLFDQVVCDSLWFTGDRLVHRGTRVSEVVG